MIRVLVVLPFYGGSLPIGRYCTSALRENGCLVDVFEAPEFYSAFKALETVRAKKERIDFLEHSFLNVVNEAILAQVERFQPDIVLAMAQAPLNQRALKRLRADGVPTAMWFMEDFRLFTYWRAFAPLYDIFAVIQKGGFFSELSSIGVENMLYLPVAAQPDIHKPLDLTPADKTLYGSALSFMGAGYPNRRNAFKELIGYDFKIWGTEWDGDTALAPLVQMQGARISTEDTVKIFNASSINLNLHSSVKAAEAVSNGEFVNPRTFELAACGAFQLVDTRSCLPDMFEADELATFSSIQELKEKIDYYLQNPAEREKVAAKSRERVLAEHTYAKRMEKLLSFAAECLPHFPRSKSAAPWPENLPEELKGELSTLLDALALPCDADFDDVVAAVRIRNSKLTPLESAILFLDEWKKQYSK